MSAPEYIEREAATWVGKMERGLTASEQDDFLQWLTVDPRHGDALAEARAGWQRLDLLAHWRPEHSPVPNRDLLAPRPLGFLRWGAPISRRTSWWIGGSFLAAASLAVGLFVAHPRVYGPSSALPTNSIASIRTQTLEDGTVVTLNRGAVLSIHYTTAERRVGLERGEAHFAVAKNPLRPFIVIAGGVDVRAVGTAFNVRLNSTAVEVLVTEGRVQVNPPPLAGTPTGNVPLPSVLVAGQSAVVALAPTASPPVVTKPSPQQAQAMLAWQPRMLEYSDAPLSDIVRDFNRCNDPIHLVIADPELGTIPVSASLRSDNVEGFIRLLESGFGVTAERAGDVVTLRKNP